MATIKAHIAAFNKNMVELIKAIDRLAEAARQTQRAVRAVETAIREQTETQANLVASMVTTEHVKDEER